MKQNNIRQVMRSFVFSRKLYSHLIRIAPLYVGKEITSFKEMADRIDKHIKEDGKAYHTAIRYGVSQACLHAVALSKSKVMAQVIADEYNTEISSEIIPIFSQSGDDRYLNADKMIMKGVDVLPHALFNHVETKVGMNGEKIKEYLEWLNNELQKQTLSNLQSCYSY